MRWVFFRIIMAGYTENELAKDLADKEYQYGFISDIDSDVVPAGLTEQIIQIRSIETFLELAKSPNAKVIITDGKTPYLVE